MDFIQGPVAKTTVSKVPKRQVSVMRSGLLATMPATLDAAGVIQTIKPSADWSVLATYAGGTDPAILSRPMGEGRVVYLAAQLTVDSRRAVLDRLMEQCRVARPIRMHTPDGGYPSGVESRTVSCEGAFLTYLANTTDRSVAVTLAARAPIGEFWDYNRAERVSGPAMTLAPFETRIMRIRLRP